MADLFSDGFESGDLSAWDSSAVDGGDLSVSADAAIHGDYGLSCLIDDTTAIYVRDDTPNNEKRYRARVYIDPNSITIPDNGGFLFLRVLTSGNATVVYVALQYSIGAGYSLRFYTRDDSWTVIDYIVNITDAPHCIEFDWKAASAGGANDGSFEVWVDGVSAGAAKTTIDSDTLSVAYTLVGAVLQIPVDTSGEFYLDDFASNNDGSAIGLISESVLKSKMALLGVG